MEGLRSMNVLCGVRAEEAVALLRRFYAQENQAAPVPQKRTKRQLELAQEVQEQTTSHKATAFKTSPPLATSPSSDRSSRLETSMGT